jgi:uncharacterized protein (DUF58 family)
MAGAVEADAALRPGVRPTSLGWALIAGSVLLLSTRFWSAEFLPVPVTMPLGLGLAAALALAWWTVPRRLREVDARWRLPEAVPVNEEVSVGALVTVRGGCPPFELHAHDPGSGGSALAMRLKALGQAQVRPVWPMRFPTRGLVRLPPVELRCRQPFGAFEARRPGDGPGELMVLPAVGSVRRAFRTRLSTWLSASSSAEEPGEDEVAHLRPYRPGDPPRTVHWRASARARRLLVTERHDLVCRRIAVVLDCAGQLPPRRFELLVSAAATAVDELCALGWTVSVHGPFAPDGVLGDRLRLLSALALAAPCNAPAQLFLPHGSATLLLTGEAREGDGSSTILALDLASCESLMRLPRPRQAVRSSERRTVGGRR